VGFFVCLGKVLGKVLEKSFTRNQLTFGWAFLFAWADKGTEMKDVMLAIWVGFMLDLNVA